VDDLVYEYVSKETLVYKTVGFNVFSLLNEFYNFMALNYFTIDQRKVTFITLNYLIYLVIMLQNNDIIFTYHNIL